MKSITEVNSESDSIEVSKNAKDEYSWKIKVYGESLTTIANTIKELDEKLRNQYLKEKE